MSRTQPRKDGEMIALFDKPQLLEASGIVKR
jgi:hypothetical protein